LRLSIFIITILRVRIDCGYIVCAKLNRVARFWKNFVHGRLRFAHDNMDTEYAQVCDFFNDEIFYFKVIFSNEKTWNFVGHINSTKCHVFSFEKITLK
jgi:hypothetical protein